MERDARRSVEWAAERLHALTRGATLDVGCGEGRFLPPEAIGLDHDLGKLRVARERSTRVVRADAHALPFRHAAFDTVYANRMLNDAERIDDVLAEIRRVMRPGGRLLVFTRARRGEGDRLDRSNGEGRLRRHFARVTSETHPDDDRAALFVARRDAASSTS